MKKAIALAALGAVLFSGCSKEEKVTAEDIQSYQLTEDDISRFVKSFSKIDQIMTAATKTMGAESMMNDPYTVFANIQPALTKQQKAIIAEAGFESTAEFLKVVGSITAAYNAVAMKKALEEVKAQMNKTVQAAPKSQQADLRKELDTQLAQMESKSKTSYQVSDHNLQIVEKHFDELTKAFTGGMGM